PPMEEPPRSSSQVPSSPHQQVPPPAHLHPPAQPVSAPAHPRSLKERPPDLNLFATQLIGRAESSHPFSFLFIFFFSKKQRWLLEEFPSSNSSGRSRWACSQ